MHVSDVTSKGLLKKIGKGKYSDDDSPVVSMSM